MTGHHSAIRSTHQQTGGRLRGVRRMCVAAAAALFVSAVAAAADPEPGPQVSVLEDGGIYTVAARFAVPEPAAIVLAVLSDYEEIPRFMPQIKTSVVLERSGDRTLVEQEAVARLLAFSKHVHLVLEIDQDAQTLRFRDRCGVSFKSYSGAWRVSEQDGRTEIGYELRTEPAFDVPPFLLKRLLKRDSAQTIEQLRREIAARGALRAAPPRSGR